MAPKVDFAWLRRIMARLRRMARPARDDRIRIVPAVTLFDLSVELMKRAETKIDLPARARALLFRDGLMIAILCVCALRARNIAAMTIDKNLQRRADICWVCFAANETKNRRPIEIPLPEVFLGWIERYLDHYRPQVLCRSATPVGGDGFWISNGGRQLTAKGIGRCVSAVTERELGRAANPHLFRKIIPTELAIRDPAHVGIAQPILGHATYATTQHAYNLGRSLDAANRHHALLQSIRTGSGAATLATESAEGSGERSTDRLSPVSRIARRSSRRGVR